MTSRRWYDERQVSEIFRIAGSRQGTNMAVPRQARGLSLKDLKALAQEAGFSTESIAEAIRTLDERDRTYEPFAILGTWSTFTLERALEGPIDEDTWCEIVDEGRRSAGVTGLMAGKGPTREWNVKEGLLSLQISAIEKDRYTTLRLVTERKSQLLLIWISSGIGVLLGGALLGKGLSRLGLPAVPMLGFSIGLVALLVVIVRGFVASWARRDRRKLAALMATMETIAIGPDREPASAVLQQNGPEML